MIPTPERIVFYQDLEGVYHFKVVGTLGETLLSGSTPRYLEMLEAAPALHAIRITEERMPRPAPQWALCTRLLARTGYDMRAAIDRASRWELAMFEGCVWVCLATLTYIVAG